MGVAMVLNPCQTSVARALLRLTLCDTSETHMIHNDLECLRQQIPVASCLPLLSLLAQGRSGSVVIKYLDTLRLGIEVCSVAPLQQSLDS